VGLVGIKSESGYRQCSGPGTHEISRKSHPEFATRLQYALTGGASVAKPNYRFDKRQREIKKNQQQEEKRLKKLARKEGTPAEAEAGPAVEETTPSTEKAQ